ncbi:MAG: hypothetical protein BGO50_15345 [Rhodanobacter sp. 67-28]|nr:MAG: hypothetical protein BGO50_15345 [Rhodanobacter sp. 67-28]
MVWPFTMPFAGVGSSPNTAAWYVLPASSARINAKRGGPEELRLGADCTLATMHVGSPSAIRERSRQGSVKS